MQQHFRLLGWLSVVFGIIGNIGVAVTAGLVHAMSSVMSSEGSGRTGDYTELPEVLFSSWPLMIPLAVTLLGTVAGIGLLKRKSWARIPTIVASILILPGFPFWTALGVYGLWAMCSSEGAQAWKEYVESPGSSGTPD